LQFAISNENPVTIIVKNLRRALPSITTLSLLGIQDGNGTVLNFANRKKTDWSEIWQEIIPGDL
uniref:SLC12 domain-containing protein n=1 Tax=Gongylonema pulchrum TaxID=637853 RepID=A0A183CZI3_9BILA